MVQIITSLFTVNYSLRVSTTVRMSNHIDERRLDKDQPLWFPMLNIVQANEITEVLTKFANQHTFTKIVHFTISSDFFILEKFIH